MCADDCVIYCKISKRVTKNIKHILNRYCRVSGHLVNYHKFKVQVSKCINYVERNRISDILQITSTNTLGAYLGCQNIDKKRRRKKVDFEGIIEE